MDASVTSRQCRVAVIGAGAAGLVTARELRREGHDVVVFEQQQKLGGTWLYSDEVESDLLGQDPKRHRVHGSMYQGLTTNLPRDIMGFSDFPFTPKAMAGRSMDSRLFPCSEEVLRYLQVFAEHYHLLDLIRFNTHIVQAEPATNTPADIAAATGTQLTDVPWQRWQVTWQEGGKAVSSKCSTAGGSQQAEPDPSAAVASAQSDANCAGGLDNKSSSMHTELFDAVLVCNGHFTEPNLPNIPGAAEFPGLLMHSHNYRQADAFKGQHIAVIGASYSGLDIARLVAQQAAQVYVCAREWSTPKQLAGPAVKACTNTQKRGMITRLTSSGGAEFAVGAAVPHLDAVICCTGFNYHFKFLDLQALGLSTARQHVAPLYQHMFPPSHAPGLAFIGLPWLVVPFPMFELQAKLCARLLSGHAALPSAEVMAAAAEQEAADLAAEGAPPRLQADTLPCLSCQAVRPRCVVHPKLARFGNACPVGGALAVSVGDGSWAKQAHCSSTATGPQAVIASLAAAG